MIPPHLFFQIYLRLFAKYDCTPPKCGDLSDYTDSDLTEVEDLSSRCMNRSDVYEVILSYVKYCSLNILFFIIHMYIKLKKIKTVFMAVTTGGGSRGGPKGPDPLSHPTQISEGHRLFRNF